MTDLHFTLIQSVEFSAHHNSIEDFDGGNTKSQTHTSDMKPRDFVFITIDNKQMGVGGDNSWGKEGLAYKQYQINSKKCKYSFTIGFVDSQ